MTDNVQAMDAQSVQQFFVKNGSTVARAVAHDFSTNQTTLQAMREQGEV